MATRLEKVREKSAALAHKGKHDKALELWRDACKKEPFDPYRWIGRGEECDWTLDDARRRS